MNSGTTSKHDQGTSGDAIAVEQALTRARRIRRRPEFTRVYDRGRKLQGRFMTLFILSNTREVSRLGIAATRKIGGAVERNRAKRRAREIFRTTPIPPGFDVVLIPRREMVKAPHVEVEADYRAVLSRAERGHGSRRERR